MHDKEWNTILIIDDDELNRELLTFIFSSYYDIEKAENGQIGLDMIHAHPDKYCAILLDVMMPVLDGIKVLEDLNSWDYVTKTPVFLITAESNDHVIFNAYEMGVMDVIGKPIVAPIVTRRINSVVELFKTRKQLNATVESQAMHIVHQMEQILELNTGMIEALATAVEFRSGESGSHVRRIYGITKMVLSLTNWGDSLTSEQIEHIALASILHDIGKISIEDSILNKPGKLTEEEYAIMKTHTTLGAEMVEKIPQMRKLPFYEYVIDIARHHHERYDGRGYPDGLKNDEISPWAQVVSLADVYDALVSPRVYKKSFSFEEAKKMIYNGKCGVFNPDLLHAFFDIEDKIRSLYMEDDTHGQDLI